MLYQGWALAMMGACAEALENLRSFVELCRAEGVVSQPDPASKMVLVSAYRRGGDAVEALNIADEILTNRDGLWEQWVEPEVHRLKGDLLLTANSQDQSGPETSYLQAIDVARTHGAKAWELRAATSLARLWCDQGKAGEGYRLLAPVYGWFTEGFDTADLQDAKALLSELEKRGPTRKVPYPSAK